MLMPKAQKDLRLPFGCYSTLFFIHSRGYIAAFKANHWASLPPLLSVRPPLTLWNCTATLPPCALLACM